LGKGLTSLKNHQVRRLLPPFVQPLAVGEKDVIKGGGSGRRRRRQEQRRRRTTAEYFSSNLSGVRR